jgi:hypothetical protein
MYIINHIGLCVHLCITANTQQLQYLTTTFVHTRAKLGQ